MTKRVARNVTIALLALAFVWGLAAGSAQPTTVYGADPTPTPAQTNGEPGGHGGGGG